MRKIPKKSSQIQQKSTDSDSNPKTNIITFLNDIQDTQQEHKVGVTCSQDALKQSHVDPSNHRQSYDCCVLAHLNELKINFLL